MPLNNFLIPITKACAIMLIGFVKTLIKRRNLYRTYSADFGRRERILALWNLQKHISSGLSETDFTTSWSTRR